MIKSNKWLTRVVIKFKNSRDTDATHKLIRLTVETRNIFKDNYMEGHFIDD